MGLLDKQNASIAAAQSAAETLVAENKTLREQVGALNAQLVDVAAKVVEPAEVAAIDEGMAKLQATLTAREI